MHLSGNRCNHIASSPRLLQDLNTVKFPYVIERAKNNLNKYYIDSGKWLPHLRYLRLTKSKRTIRSERREALIAVVRAILIHTDLGSLRVGHISKNDNEIHPIRIETIAKYANVGIKRCHRVVQVLKQAGYLEIQPRYQKISSGYKGLAAIKKISILLFYHLGISREQLNKARKKSQLKVNNILDQSKLFIMKTLLSKKAKRFGKPYRNPTIDPPGYLTPEQNKALCCSILHYKIKYPEKSTYEIDSFCRKQLGLPPRQ